MNAMVPGLAGAKMSSSDPNSKIDFLDSPKVVKNKIGKAFCEEGDIVGNGVLAFAKAVLIPISQSRIERRAKEGAGDGSLKPFVLDDAPAGTVFSIARPEKYGGPVHYTSYEALEKDFEEKKLFPGDLKTGVTDAINSLLAPIQKEFAENKEFQQAAENAYPVEAPPKKENKKKVSCVFHFFRGHSRSLIIVPFT